MNRVQSRRPNATHAGACLSLIGALASGSAAASPINLITNGSFENTTALYSSTQGGQINNSDLAGWSTSTCLYICGSGPGSVWIFLAAPNYATNGVDFQGGQVNFWSGPGASPDGGNAITADASNQLGALQQSLTNLVVGDHYQLTFYQATMQAIDANANTSFTANWQVSLGGATQYSTTMSNPYQGYSPWQQVTMDFTATAANETLSFLANSPTAGDPPFLLLDGVALYDIPEPASLGVLAMGFIGILATRGKRQAATATEGVLF